MNLTDTAKTRVRASGAPQCVDGKHEVICWPVRMFFNHVIANKTALLLVSFRRDGCCFFSGAASLRPMTLVTEGLYRGVARQGSFSQAALQVIRPRNGE